MANERMYLVKTQQGEEFGPLDQAALVKYAENGRIHHNDKIRSTLIPQWQKAISYSFLEKILQVQVEEEMEQQHNTFKERLMRQIRLEAVTLTGEAGLVKVRLQGFPSAHWFTRLLAAVVDILVVVAGVILLTAICYGLLRETILTADNAAYVLGILVWLWCLLYYTLTIALGSQTVGQRFWGIFLVRKDGNPFFTGRAFFYALFMFAFGWLTIPMCIVMGRSLQEVFTKSRMVKVRLAGIKR